MACVNAGVEPIRHAGVGIPQGTIFFTSGGIVEAVGTGAYSGQELKRRADAYVGDPFVTLNLPAHFSSLVFGRPVGLDHFMMVWNDANTIDTLAGPGAYEKHCNAREHETLKVARDLYAADRKNQVH